MVAVTSYGVANPRSPDLQISNFKSMDTLVKVLLTNSYLATIQASTIRQ